MSGAYLELGFDHILDPKGIDHILFIIALCAVFTFKEWKKVLILVTAFTLGHSLTLALSALDIINISASLVETLIPITIILTALVNIGQEALKKRENISASYIMAAGFGLIHGLGFSNFFKALLGKEDNIVLPLLSFNIGVELGQIIIVSAVLFLSYILVDLCRVPKRMYSYGLSIIALILALGMMLGFI